MSTTPPSRTAPPEIERLFQVALFLLVVTGFATLAATGKLDLLSTVIVLAALGLRGFLLVRDRPVSLPPRLTFWLAVAYFPLFLLDFYFLSARDFVAPAVHLVLFGISVKLFDVKRERDYLYLAILSFLMVLSAAILTVDTAFLAAFALFVVLAVFCFMALELRRSSLASANLGSLILPGRRTRRRQVSPMQRLSASLARTTAVMVAAILLTGTALFFALPRISGGYLSRYAQSDALSTGFSDTVNLGAIGAIQQSSEVVAHIHIEGDQEGTHQIRLRGSVLSIFDGHRWRQPYRAPEVLTQGYGRIFQLAARPVASEHEEFRLARAARPEFVRYRVLMEPINAPVLFTIPTAQAIFGSFREVGVDDDQSFHNLDRERGTAMYEGISDLSEPTPAQLEKLSGAAAGQIAMPSRYLMLPPALDPRIRQLASAITSRESNPYRQAAAIERYLKTQYSYTLQLPSEAPEDPIADFLFHRRRGHCEYFASSMAVLLRASGIPSRVITGFRGAQFNQVNATYVVRARDAHAWVEAYLPNVGWTTFDPTPAGAAVATSPWTRAQLYMDAAREFWREWIVNYDTAHQHNLTVTGVRQSRHNLLRLGRWGREKYAHMMETARRVEREATHDPQQLLAPARRAAFALGALLLPLALWRIRREWRLPSATRAPRQLSTQLYLRLERRLARRGYLRKPSQTPAEFAASIGEPELRHGVEQFILVYERARYGANSEDAARLASLLRQLRQQLS